MFRDDNRKWPSLGSQGYAPLIHCRVHLSRWFFFIIVILFSRQKKKNGSGPENELQKEELFQHEGRHPEQGRGQMELETENYISHAAVEEEDSRTRLTQKTVHQVRNHPNKNAWRSELQCDRPKNPFSEESKQHGISAVRNLSSNSMSLLLEELDRRDRLL